MESFMVKYYCDILIPNESCEVVSSVTEDLVHLFLTIRGYAVTRLEHNKLQKSSNGKASLSLRQVLKEKTPILEQAKRKCHKAFVVHHGFGFCTIVHTSEQNCGFQNYRKTCLSMKVCVLNT
jgi:hypothetical protein